MSGNRPQYEDPRNVGVDVKLGELADDRSETRVGAKALRARCDPDPASARVDMALVYRGRLVVADEDGRDPAGPIEPAAAPLDDAEQLARVAAPV